MEYTLARYDAAKRAIAECESFDEVKPWADKAAALAAYARQADDPELEAHARRIRLRATKRIGEISAALETSPKAKGGQETRLPTGGKPKTEVLRKAGISTSVANRAEKIAAIPAEDFDRAVDAAHPPTLADMIIREANRAKAPAPTSRNPIPPTADIP